MAHPDQATELDRATAYRQSCENRAEYRERLSRSLAGDPAAAAEVHSNWAATRGPFEIPDPPCALEDTDPPRPAWLGRVPGWVELPQRFHD